MYKNIEDKREASRRHYKKHREEILKKQKVFDKIYRNNNREKILKRNRLYRLNNPWFKTLQSINKRVQGKESKKRYFDKGITSDLTIDNLKMMWFRDNAYNMKKPTIHREDNNGNYTIENCRYLEFSEHSRYHRIMEQEGHYERKRRSCRGTL